MKASHAAAGVGQCNYDILVVSLCVAQFDPIFVFIPARLPHRMLCFPPPRRSSGEGRGKRGQLALSAS